MMVFLIELERRPLVSRSSQRQSRCTAGILPGSSSAEAQRNVLYVLHSLALGLIPSVNL